MAANYELILEIINASDDPAEALRAFVDQEREHAAYEAAMVVMPVERLATYPDAP
jgi:hypothetical protein